jgi:hypothetical protein
MGRGYPICKQQMDLVDRRRDELMFDLHMPDDFCMLRSSRMQLRPQQLVFGHVVVMQR